MATLKLGRTGSRGRRLAGLIAVTRELNQCDGRKPSRCHEIPRITRRDAGGARGRLLETAPQRTDTVSARALSFGCGRQSGPCGLRPGPSHFRLRLARRLLQSRPPEGSFRPGGTRPAPLEAGPRVSAAAGAWDTYLLRMFLLLCDLPCHVHRAYWDWLISSLPNVYSGAGITSIGRGGG